MSSYLLSEEDEKTHKPSEHKNFNESVYVNGIDHKTRSGLWMRLGNRLNEGYAELQLCFYLPDGRLACQFQRPSISNNESFSAGGMTYTVDKPLQAVSMDYNGEVMVLDDLNLLRDPKRLFTESTKEKIEITSSLAALSPVHGGEPANDEQPTMYGRDFSLGHFFQQMRTNAKIKLGADTFEIDGFGWRDHSWGPRYWTNIHFYRLLIVNFDNGDGFTMLKITDRDGVTRRCGVMNIAGCNEDITDVDLFTEWSAEKDPVKITLGLRTAKRSAVMHGTVTTMAPLRNRRKLDTGELLETRIAEGFTEWSWGDVKGFGLSEYIERIEDGQPVGYPL